jgi:predicted DsbA family dithiol-disulfide isomerase
VGLDVAAATTFLDTDELEQDVWNWYGKTIHEKRIHSIPLFVFNVPSIDAMGAPFRPAGKRSPYVVNGSMDKEYFLALFERITADVAKVNKAEL